MFSLNEILTPAWQEAIGWTLLHGLWQGIVIVLALRLALHLTQNRSSQTRYLIALASMVLLFVWTLSTLIGSYQRVEEELVTSSLLVEVSEVLPLTGEYTSWNQIRELFMEFVQENHGFWVSVWLIGAFLFFAKWLGSLAYVSYLKRSGIALDKGPWEEALYMMRSYFPHATHVQIKFSPKVYGPMVLGWLKPVVLIPMGMVNGLSHQQMEAVLAHELAHIRRYDYLVNLIQSMLEIVFFYHPAWWVISREIAEAREHCCDDIAVAVSGNAKTYVETLAQIAESQMTFQLGQAMGGKRNHVLARIQRIISPGTMNKQQNYHSGLMLSIILMISLLHWSFSSAKQAIIEKEVLSDLLAQVEDFYVEVPEAISVPLEIGEPEPVEVPIAIEAPVNIQVPLAKIIAHSIPKEIYYEAMLENAREDFARIAWVDTPPPAPMAFPAMPAMPAVPAIPPIPPIPAMPNFDFNFNFDFDFDGKYDDWSEEEKEQFQKSMKEFELKMDEWKDSKEWKNFEKSMEKWQESFGQNYESALGEWQEEIERSFVPQVEAWAEQFQDHENENIDREELDRIRAEAQRVREEARRMAEEARMMEREQIQQLREEARRVREEARRNVEESRRHQERELYEQSRKLKELERQHRDRVHHELERKRHTKKERMRNMLLEDGLIKQSGYSFSYKKGEIKVNGKKLKGEMAKKYIRYIEDNDICDGDCSYKYSFSDN